MSNKQLAAKKLEAAMKGLMAEYRSASPSERVVLASTMREIREVQSQLIKADEDEAAPTEVDHLMSDDSEDESMDEMSEDSDIPMDESPDDDEMASDDLPAEDDESDADESEADVSVEGLNLPADILGDLRDLGLLNEEGLAAVEELEGVDAPTEDEAAVADDMADDLGGEVGAEDEELALAALDLAARALKASIVKAEDEADDESGYPKDDDFLDEESEEEDGVLDEDEILALEMGLSARAGEPAAKDTSVSATAKKLQEIAARLSKIRSSSELTPAAEAPSDEDVLVFDEVDSPEVLAFSEYAALMASYDANERRELLRPESPVSAKKMSPADLAKLKKREDKNRLQRKKRGPVMTSKAGKNAAVRLPGGKSKKVKKKYYFTVYDAKGKNLGQHWMSKKRPSKETLDAYKEKHGVKHPFALPETRPSKK